MAISFKEAQGKAKKNAAYYKYTDGENTLRFVGGLLPRYSYWIKDEANKDHSIECLGFDRETEQFLNAEKDWVRHYWPDKKCSWSYAIQAIDTKTNKLVLVPLKKKLFEQIQVAAEDLGDPTSIEDGWDVVFKKVKTGPLNFNVEYTLQVLRCKKRPLSSEERALLDEMKPIDELLPRPTPDQQKEYIERMILKSEGDGGNDSVPDGVGGSAEDDDIPY